MSEGDSSETFRQATRLAEDRIAEVAAAMSALKTENEAFRDRLEGQLSENYEKRHERLLLSSVQTLEAMDRAIEAARNSDAAESLISGVMLVRTQLFRILQEEGLERVSVLGLPFDRRSAEAVQRRPVTDPDQDALVIEELQGGHQLRGHIIRRAKVVVGEFVDEAAEATVIVKSMGKPMAPPPVTTAAPAVSEAPTPAAPEPVEATVAMPAVADEAVPASPVPSSDDTPEDPIVVEDWNEPTHPGTPAALLGLPAAKLVAPAAPPEEEGDAASTTMVLGDEAAAFVRPPARAASPRGASAPAAEPAEASRWKAAAAWPKKGPTETQPVPPATREAPVRPATTGYPPPRVRTGPVPRTPPRDRSPVYEEVPTSPSEPAAPRPATPTNPGVAAGGPAGGGGRLSIGLVVVAVAVLTAVAIAWWVLGRRPKPPEVGGQVAPATQPVGGRSEATPLAASPVAVAPSPVIEEDVTVVRPSTGEASALPSPGAATPAAGTQVPVPGLPTPAPAAVAPPAATPPPIKAAPATARPTPPPAAPVNPVPALLSQAEQAMAARRYNEAITRFGEVLKLEPQNAEAAAGKLRAQGERASVGRYFLTAVTMSEGKA
ncbi:MAG TPA: nucleotide exchange factor GrpE, partial [Vicinamibacteria bacterium]